MNSGRLIKFPIHPSDEERLTTPFSHADGGVGETTCTRCKVVAMQYRGPPTAAGDI